MFSLSLEFISRKNISKRTRRKTIRRFSKEKRFSRAEKSFLKSLADFLELSSKKFFVFWRKERKTFAKHARKSLFYSFNFLLHAKAIRSEHNFHFTFFPSAFFEAISLSTVFLIVKGVRADNTSKQHVTEVITNFFLTKKIVTSWNQVEIKPAKIHFL